MKKALKIFIYYLFEFLSLPLLLIFVPYLIYLRKFRAIKLMDKISNTLMIIEDKLQKI